MPEMQFGTGSPLLGGATGALSQVMQQQGMDPSVLSQQSPAAAGFDPGIVPPQVEGGQPTPDSAPQGVIPPTGAPTPDGGLPPQQPAESQMIIDILGTRLKSISKQDEGKSIPPAQPSQPLDPYTL